MVESLPASHCIHGLCKAFHVPDTNSTDLHCMCTSLELFIIATMQVPGWDSGTSRTLFLNAYYILASWMKWHHGMHRLWRTFALFNIAMAVMDAANLWKKRGWMREILRCFETNIQHIILTKNWSCKQWQQQLAQQYTLISGKAQCDDAAIVYIKWAAEVSKPYVGKANIIRKARCQHFGAIVHRLREHWLLTYSPYASRSAESTRTRYALWKGTPPESCRWIPVQLASTKRALQLENHFYTCLSQPLNETRIKFEHIRPSGTSKPFKRFRRTPGVDDEFRSNFCSSLSQTIRSKLRGLILEHSASVILEHVRTRIALTTQKAFQDYLYKVGSEAFLALHLSIPAIRCDWKRLWANKVEVKNRVAKVYEIAKLLPFAARRTVHGKIRNFTRKTRVLPSTACHVTIPCNNPSIMQAAKRCMRTFLVGACKTSEVRNYMLDHVILHKGRGRNIMDMQGQRETARNTKLDMCKDTRRFRTYELRKDVIMSPETWFFHLPDDIESIQQSLNRALHDLQRRYRLCKSKIHAMSCTTSGPDAKRRTNHGEFRKPNNDRVLVPLDKDSKRFVEMDKLGLQARLLFCYAAKPEHYTFCHGTSHNNIARTVTNCLVSQCTYALHCTRCRSEARPLTERTTGGPSWPCAFGKKNSAIA